MPYLYEDTETQVTVYTRYRISNTFDTYGPYTAVCVELETDRGPLIVYGTIMGIFGNREQPECVDHIAISDSFAEGMNVTMNEWNQDKVLSDHKGICVDLN